jgi:hypothetical protein
MVVMELSVVVVEVEGLELLVVQVEKVVMV